MIIKESPQANIQQASQREVIARRTFKLGIAAAPVLAISSLIGIGGANEGAAATPEPYIPPTKEAATPVPTRHIPTMVPTDEPAPTKEAKTPTPKPHTETPVPTDTPPPTKEANTPTPKPHTATPEVTATKTVTKTPTVTRTPRPGETFTPTATATREATATATKTPKKGETPTPTATPKPDINPRIIYTGLSAGESIKVVSREPAPLLGKESDVAGIDFSRDNTPMFGGDVAIANEAIIDLHWNGQTVARNVASYEIPEDPDMFGQIPTNDPDRLLFTIHSSLANNPEPGKTPLGSRLDEVKTGDTVALFVNGESKPYKVVFSGEVNDVTKKLNERKDKKTASFVTCIEGENPLTNPERRYMVIAQFDEPEATVELPIIGTVDEKTANQAGLVLGGLALGAAGFYLANRRNIAKNTR